jgi:hypothetical protein
MKAPPQQYAQQYPQQYPQQYGQQYPQPQFGAPYRGKSNKTVIIIAVVIGVLLIGGGITAAILLGGGSSSSTTTTTGTGPNTPGTPPGPGPTAPAEPPEIVANKLLGAWGNGNVPGIRQLCARGMDNIVIQQMAIFEGAQEYYGNITALNAAGGNAAGDSASSLWQISYASGHTETNTMVLRKEDNAWKVVSMVPNQ